MKARVVLEELEGIPLLTFTNTPGAPFPMFLKRVQDITASAIGMVLTAPLLPFIAAAVKLVLAGPRALLTGALRAQRASFHPPQVPHDV